MTKPTWLEPRIGQLRVHVFEYGPGPVRGHTPDTKREFRGYEFNPMHEEKCECIGVYKLDDLEWH